MKAVILKITGDVQGVSYRYWARQVSGKLGLSGWAKNEHDGTVSWFIQGLPGNVDKAVELAREGSPMATVDKVEIEKVVVDKDMKGFVVK